MADAGAKAPTASATNSTAPEPSEKPLMLTAPTACPSAMVAKSASMGWLDRKFANSDMWPLQGRLACQHCELFLKAAPAKPMPPGGNLPGAMRQPSVANRSLSASAIVGCVKI